MLNHQGKQKLVKPSSNADHALTANDSDDDDEQYIFLNVRNHKARNLSLKRTFFIGCTFLTILVTFIIGFLIHENYNPTPTDNSTEGEASVTGSNNNAENIALKINPVDLTQKTVTPKLPGIYFMNKAYNLLVGKQLYEQTGVDIISYTFTDQNGHSMYTSSTPAYMVPFESGTVTIEQSCSTSSTPVYYTTSVNVLHEQSKTASEGFQAKVDLTASGTFKVGDKASGGANAEVSAKAKTQMTFGLMFGHTSSSKTATAKASNKFSHSFSLNSVNKFYRAAIDWDDTQFTWKPTFLGAIDNLKTDYTNQKLLKFINDYGTHVLTKMQAGSYCKRTAYIKSNTDQSQIDSFHQQVSTHGFNFINKFSDKQIQTDTYCVGEADTSSSGCAGPVSRNHTNNPIVTSYESLPIWQISYINQQLGSTAVTNINTFFSSLYTSLQDCSNTYCNSYGVCLLDSSIWSSSFINQWDGNDFSQLWGDQNHDEYCFCDSDYPQGKNCNACSCYGDTDCCCIVGNVACNKHNLCNNVGMCVSQSSQTTCGGTGQFINCDALGGVVIGICDSGSTYECSNSGYCGDGSETAISCGYSALGKVNHIGNEDDEWWCSGTNWQQMSCKDSKTKTGDLLVGICGSSINEDCKTSCEGHMAIQCSTIPGISVDWDQCIWIGTPTYGIFQKCPDGYVGTGVCLSGALHDCPDSEGNSKTNNHNIQCCKLKHVDLVTPDIVQ